MPYFIPKKTPLRLVPWTVSQILQRLLVQRHDRAPEPGIVEQHVELSESLFSSGDHPPDVGLDGDIDVNCDCRITDDFRRLVFVATAVRADDLGPFCGE